MDNDETCEECNRNFGIQQGTRRQKRQSCHKNKGRQMPIRTFSCNFRCDVSRISLGGETGDPLTIKRRIPQFQIQFSSNIVTLTICLFLLSQVPTPVELSSTSRIVFENGVYHNILMALSDDAIRPENCSPLIRSIQETFERASVYLHEFSGGRASFGKIRILIPRHFDSLKCNTTGKAQVIGAEIRENYDAADLKVSASHPFAEKLPWTNGVGCGETGENIFIPPSFYLDARLTGEERSRILLHDWLIYRYGVFPEYGFLDDPLYSPCYRNNNQIFYSGCSAPLLGPISNLTQSLSPAECTNLILNNLDKIKKDLMSVQSSVLSAPHLSTTTTTYSNFLCSDKDHNWLSNTKQNIECSRRSVGQVMMSHEDFVQNRQFPKGKVQIEVVQHSAGTQLQGYAFVIENSENIRRFNGLRHVKQSIAEFVHLVNESSRSMAAVLTYNGEFHVLPEIPLELSDESFKVRFLNRIPDVDTSPLASRFYNPSRLSNQPKNNHGKSLKVVFDTLKDRVLDTQPGLKWNIILITSLPPLDLTGTLETISKTDHSVSILTFDESAEWLQWNSIPQTRKLLHLPLCYRSDSGATGVVCSTKTSSLLTDHFLELLSDQQPTKRFFHKIADLELKGSEREGSFVIPSSMGTNVRNFFITLPRYSEQTSINLVSPTGVRCGSQPLLNYAAVLTMNERIPGCSHETGTWRFTLEGISPSHSPNISHAVRCFVETFESPGQDVVVELPSASRHLSAHLISPTQSPLLPLYVSVRNKKDGPIINAVVQAEVIYSTNESNLMTSTVIDMLDDGVEPDVTKDDGIYSMFLRGLSPNPSYHSGSISVTSSASTASIQNLLPDSNKAALFDPRSPTTSDLEQLMQGKCCGSLVSAGDLEPVTNVFYSVTLPSFRTNEFMPNPGHFPPSRINLVQVVSETSEVIQLRFTAPRTNLDPSHFPNQPHHYDLCRFGDCKGNECLCLTLESTTDQQSDCQPVTADLLQDCHIDKRLIVDNLLLDSEKNTTVGQFRRSSNRSTGEMMTRIVITCGIRAVNPGNIPSEISSTLFQISLSPLDDQESGAVKSECKNVSDGCLPIDIFWILIGILSALALILLLIAIVWCCQCAKEKRRKKRDKSLHHLASKDPKTNKGKRKSDQDTGDEFNSRGLYARDSPQFHRTSFKRVKKEQIVTRRQSVSGGTSETNDPTYREGPRGQGDEMPIFFSKRPISSPPGQALSTSFNHENHSSSRAGRSRSRYGEDAGEPINTPLSYADHNNSRQEQQIGVSHGFQLQQQQQQKQQHVYLRNPRNSMHNPKHTSHNDARTSSNLRSTGAFSNNHSIGSNNNLRVHSAEPMIPTISSTVDFQPVYASVNRSKRRNPAGAPDHVSRLSAQSPYTYQQNRNNVSYENDPTDSYLSPNLHDDRNLEKLAGSAQSLDSGFVPGRLSPVLIKRMDFFPSSESETYSEMSAAPPPPPPLPSNSDLNQRRQPQVQSQQQQQEVEEREREDTDKRNKSPTPSQNNGFSILAKMGPHIPDRKSLLKPPKTGPPPPPRKTAAITTTATTSFIPNVNQSFGNQQVLHHGLNNNNTNNISNNSSNKSINKVVRDNKSVNDRIPPNLVLLPPPPASSAPEEETDCYNNNLDFDDENDDSDTWEVYDDFDFNPGVSHV